MVTQSAVNEKRKTINLGLWLYFAGILLGVVIAVLAIWGDLEASLFDNLSQSDQRLPSFSCPVLMTLDEDATIEATFTNRGQRDENLSVRARISQGFASLIREERVEFSIPPGETDTAVFEITAGDAAWDRVVLARVTTVRNAPYRRQVGSACGVLLVPIRGMTGGQIVTGIVIISLILTVLGAYLWQNGRKRPFSVHNLKVWRLMLLFGGLVGTAVLVSLLQFWLLGGITLLILFLLLISATDSFTEVP